MATQDNNTLSLIVQGGASATALAFFTDTMIRMIPWLIAAVPLIILDLIWGIRAAKCRKDEIRFSTGFRRTFGKMFEYLCWIILASTLALAFQQRWVEWIVLGLVIVNELSSIVGNFLETRGLRMNWKYLFDTIFRLGGQKYGVDTSDVDSSQFIEPIKKAKPGRNTKGQFVKKG